MAKTTTSPSIFFGGDLVVYLCRRETIVWVLQVLVRLFHGCDHGWILANLDLRPRDAKETDMSVLRFIWFLLSAILAPLAIPFLLVIFVILWIILGIRNTWFRATKDPRYDIGF